MKTEEKVSGNLRFGAGAFRDATRVTDVPEGAPIPFDLDGIGVTLITHGAAFHRTHGALPAHHTSRSPPLRPEGLYRPLRDSLHFSFLVAAGVSVSRACGRCLRWRPGLNVSGSRVRYARTSRWLVRARARCDEASGRSGKGPPPLRDPSLSFYTFFAVAQRDIFRGGIEGRSGRRPRGRKIPRRFGNFAKFHTGNLVRFHGRNAAKEKTSVRMRSNR